MQIGDILGLAFAPPAANGQHAALDLQIEVGLLEAGGCDHDSILVVTVFLDVIGWIRAAGVVTQGGLEQVIETIKAHGLPEQRGHGERTHDKPPEISELKQAGPAFGIPLISR